MAGCFPISEPVLNDIVEPLVFMKCRNSIEIPMGHRILDSTLSSPLRLSPLPAAAREKRSHCASLPRIIEARREEEEEQARAAVAATAANLQPAEAKTERKKKRRRRKKKEDGAGPRKQPRLASEAQTELAVSVLRDQSESEVVDVSATTDQPPAGELPLNQRFQQLDLNQSTVEHDTTS